MTDDHVYADTARDWSVHPGEILREALAERDLTQADLASRLGISQPAVNHIVTGARGIGVAMALKLEGALGISARLWLHLQADHNLYIARERAAGRSILRAPVQVP